MEIPTYLKLYNSLDEIYNEIGPFGSVGDTILERDDGKFTYLYFRESQWSFIGQKIGEWTVIKRMPGWRRVNE